VDEADLDPDESLFSKLADEAGDSLGERIDGDALACEECANARLYFFGCYFWFRTKSISPLPKAFYPSLLGRDQLNNSGSGPRWIGFSLLVPTRLKWSRSSPTACRIVL
jgi:hypothetical protein